MLNKLLSLLGFGNSAWNTQADFRRKYVRYPGVHAEVTVDDRAYNVRDWSLGGVSFDGAADAYMTAGEKVNVTIKFRFPHDTITIQQQAQVVRSAQRNIAAQFASLPKDARKQFEKVLDSLYAQRFMESQAA